MKKEYKKFIDEMTDVLGEMARKKNLKYTTLTGGNKFTQAKKEIEKVQVVLPKSEHEKANELSEELYHVEAELKKLNLRKEAIVKALREYGQKYFDAEDILLTRLVETCLFTIQLCKAQKRSKFDDDKFFNALFQMVPDLKDKIIKLREKYTEIYYAESRVIIKDKNDGTDDSTEQVKEEGFSDILATIGNKISKVAGFFFRAMKNWGDDYGKKLDDLKSELKQVSKGDVIEG